MISGSIPVNEIEEGIKKDTRKEMGKRIYLLRIMRGYTRECLSKMANITPKFLYEIETGRNGFSVVVLCRLCIALEINSEYILFGKMQVAFDYKLIKVIQKFDEEQTKQIADILENISNLLEDKR